MDIQELSGLKEGRRESIERLIREHTQPLLAAAFGLGFREADAEELVQDVLVAFLGSVERFEGRSTVKTFLFGILYNKARELRRQKAREAASEDIEAVFDARFGAFGIWNCFPRGPEDEALAAEQSRLLEQCSERLSVDQRTAFYMKEVENQSTEAICNILGVSATNLGVLLFRARNKLRECLEKKWGRKR
jgi:RNA polymerase sigma-70 factor, ECF subfamily